MMTDFIADFLTRVRNSVHAKQNTLVVPASNQVESLLKILKDAGYIKNFVRQEQEVQDTFLVTNKFLGKNLKPVLNRIARVSKPGCRVYCGYRDLRPLLNGMGMNVLSTPLGIMTDTEARQKKVGGEILCQIW